MRRCLAIRAIVVLALAGTLTPAAVSATGLTPPVVDGLFAIDQAPYSNSAVVTLRLVSPANSDGVIRLSNDGEHWVERDWAEAVSWSLIDPLAGGEDTDAYKTVIVQYGNGTTWSRQGMAATTLDREAPTAADDPRITIDGRTWRGHQDPRGSEELAGTRHSLDGVTWSAWTTHPSDVNLFDLPGMSDWLDGDRALWMQMRDLAGNVSQPLSVIPDLQYPRFDAPGEGPVNVTFEIPRFPVTGKPFTIKPIYPAGYVLPANAWCLWSLHWGDDASIMSSPNETWGELIFHRPKSSGACDGWTFSIPSTQARQFHWTFHLQRMGPDSDWDHPKEDLFVSSNTAAQIFRAARGSTDPRFLSSSVPIAYLLPETTVSQQGDPVTYRLHVAGTTTVPQTGSFWTYPLNCYLNPHWSQKGGTTYTYTPNCNGPWVTGWTGTMLGGYMRSQYDPIVDGRAPKVVAPRVKLRTATFGSSAPTTVSWSASDSGSGVYRYELQVSRNGRAWSSVALPSRLTTSISRPVAVTGTYRFRVRARDRVGNWSAWVAGPTVKARARQETSSLIKWSSGWTNVTSTAFSGGNARAASTSGARATLASTMRSIAWVTRSGPGRGLAQVFVDGVLVKTIDLNATTLGPRRVAFAKSWSSSKTHKIVIRLLGTVGHPLVETDAFLVIR